jgi:signal transduction histidine kinase
MAAGLAHEIRNPLGNIGTTASLLKRKLSGNDSGIVALDNIVQEVRRLNQTVTQCLEYAKPLHLRPRPVDLPVLLAEALQEVRARWPAGRVEVKETHDPEVSGLRADGIQLRQVLHNLISNAFDAMGGRGNLEIATFLEPGSTAEKDSERFAVIRIRDTGRGITPEVRERLFFPFFTTKPAGSGIGLAIAKKIVDSHQGMIDVESESGRGATFSVKLPYPGSLQATVVQVHP